VYSLGVVAYQCLAGHRPFEGENPLEIALKHVREVPRPLPGDIPPVVRSIVERSMSKDPAARWPTAATLAAVARQAAATLSAGVSVSAGPGGTPISVPPAPSSPGAPGRPVSGAPISPGPVSPPVPASLPPVGPTRIISGPAPAAAGLPRRPTSGPPAPPVSPGGFVRGAAVVPPPRPLEQTSYGYGPQTGNTGATPTPRRTGLLILAIVAATLAILACSVIIGYVVRKAGIGTNASGSETVQLPCEQLKKQSLAAAAAELERRGFEVKTQAAPGGRRNQIQDITPCRATAGAEITIVVRTG
jgi:serine/threonine-protein kinase